MSREGERVKKAAHFSFLYNIFNLTFPSRKHVYTPPPLYPEYQSWIKNWRQMWLGGQHHTPAALSHGKRRGTRGSGGRVGPRAGLNRCGGDKISCPSPGFEPRTVQPVASRYTGQRTKPQHTTKIPSLGYPRNFLSFVPLGALDVITQIGGRQTHVVANDLMWGNPECWREQGDSCTMVSPFVNTQWSRLSRNQDRPPTGRPDHHTALL